MKRGRPPTTHCYLGHEYAVTGRSSNGRCRACRALSRKRISDDVRRANRALFEEKTQRDAERLADIMQRARLGRETWEQIGASHNTQSHTVYRAWIRRATDEDIEERKRGLKESGRYIRVPVRLVELNRNRAPDIDPSMGRFEDDPRAISDMGSQARLMRPSLHQDYAGSSMGWAG